MPQKNKQQQRQAGVHTSYYAPSLLDVATPTQLVVEPEETITLLGEELLQGYIAHRDLLNSISNDDDQHLMNVDFEEQSSEKQLILDDSSSDTHQSSLAKDENNIILTPPPIFLTDVWKARLLLLLSAALYGTNFTMVKSLDESMSVGLSSTLRFGFATVAMLPWLFAPIDDELKLLAAKERRRIESISSSEDNGGKNALTNFSNSEPTRLCVALSGMEIGLYNSIGYIAQAVGLKDTSASKSAFICSLAVVTVPILDYIWGKPLLRRQVMGAFLAAFGVYALELGGQDTTITDGDVMSLVQPLVFGLGFWRMESAMERYPTEAGRLAAAQLLMVFLVSVSYLVCWSPLTGGVSDACSVLPTVSDLQNWLQDPYTMGMLLWTGVITTAFTIFMETLALKTLSAAETTLIFSTEPLFGAAFATAVAGECLGNEAAIGAAFIIGGCLVSGLDVGGLIPAAESDK